MYRYKFTVFTPCYNSANTIHRVFESLMSQTIDHSEFEWLVINDASTDNTDEIIQKYIKEADFDVKYINLEKNQMLIRNYNLAIKKAEGEWFLPTGHDDRFEPNSLEIFWSIIRKLNIKHKDKNFFSIACLCKNQYGIKIGNDFPVCCKPVKILDIGIKWNRKKIGESWGVQKTEYMKKLFVLDNEKILNKIIYIPESFFWNKIALEGSRMNLYVYPINKRLRIYYQNSNENLSKNIRKKYPMGFEHESMIMLNKYGKIIKNTSFKMYIKYLLKYILFGLYNKKNFLELLNNLKFTRDKIFFILFYPFAYLYKDIFFKEN